MDLNEMLVYVEIVRTGSLTAAARSLRMPKSSVSRALSALESRLNVQLLRRTTRKIGLTDIGEEFYRSCRKIVAEAKAAEDRVTERQATPCGRLRVTLPPTFAFLGTIVAEYLARHPNVHVEMVCTERHVDLVGEGFDLAVRTGRLVDSMLMARRLGSVGRILVTTNDYIRRHGMPRTPTELREHETIVFGGGTEGNLWPLRFQKQKTEVYSTPRLIVDDYQLLLEAVRSGLGIALLPEYVCREAIDRGDLVRVLQEWSSPRIPIHAIYPKSRQPSIKLTTFLDFLRERFTSRLAV